MPLWRKPASSVSNLPRLRANSSAPTSSTTLIATLLDGAGQALPAAGRTVTWRTLDPNVANVSASGVVTGIATSAAPVGIEVSASSPGQTTPAKDTSFVTVTNVSVTRVAITPGPSATVHVGSAYARTFTAAAYDANNNLLTGRQIVWTSDNLAVAQVTSTGGVVTGLQVGSANITATSEGVSASTTVTVDLVAIGAASTVTLSSAQPDSVVPGAANTRSFVATPRDSAGNVISGAALGGRVPIWTLSAGGTFASLTSSGATATVTPNSPGAVTVQADYGTVQASAPLRILVPVNNILLTVAPDSFFVGASAALVATARDASNSPIAGRSISVTSATPSAASIGTASGTGSLSTTVTGVSAPGGRAVVTISAAVPFDGVSNSTTVRVLAPVATITVSTPVDSIFVNGNVQATAVLRDAAGNALTGRTVSWTTGNAQIATAAQTGVITGIAAGSNSIRADAEGQQGTKTLLVQEPVSSISVSAADSSIAVGATVTATVVLQDRFGNPIVGRAVSYQSSNTAVATVSGAGVVNAVGAGTTTITATAEGKSASFPLTVSSVPVASVSVSASPPPNVHPTHTFPAAVTARDAANNVLGLTGRTISWTSSNPAIATVSAGAPGAATITAVAVGTATITASVDGVAAATPVTVTVVPVPVVSVQVTPTSASVQVGGTQAFTATARDSVNGVLPGRTITWSSGNSAKATVDPTTGVATGVDSTGAGSVNIVATAPGQGVGGTSPSGTATLSVTLVPIGSVVLSPSALTVPGVGMTATLTLATLSGNQSPLAGRACAISFTRATEIDVTPTSGVTNGSGQLTLTVLGKLATTSGSLPQVSATCEGVQSNAVNVTVP